MFVLHRGSLRAATRFREQEISLLHFASPAHKMVMSMPLMSKSGQIMASVEFSHLSVSLSRELPSRRTEILVGK